MKGQVIVLMKAATGELNLTVITLIAIAAVIGFFWIMWPNIKRSIANIKRFSEEDKEEYSYIDEETRKSRFEMCKKLRKDGE